VQIPMKHELSITVRWSVPRQQWTLKMTTWGIGKDGKYGSQWTHEEPLTDPGDDVGMRNATELAMIAVLRRQERLVTS
jgi:hypothetical protein